MMMKRFLALSALSALVVSSVFAGGDKSAQLQQFTGSLTPIQPKRMAKVALVNGKIQMLSPWIEMGDFAPAGPCDPSGATETLVFDHAAVDPNTGNLDSSRQVCIPGRRFYFGPAYHNPYYANDIKSLVDPSFNGGTMTSLTHLWFWNPNLTNPASGSQPCIIGIFTSEQFDAECQDVHEQSVIDGVLLDYGNLNAGGYFSTVCLSAIGGINLPQTPADDGDPGTELLGGYLVLYLQQFDPNTNTGTLASGAQPFLWHPTLTNPQIGDSTSVQFDDDNPTDGDHIPAECYDYTYDLSQFGCPNPSLLGGAIAFWVQAAGCQPHNGDVDENGCVDDADLLAVLFAFGSSSAGREDVNCDGTVDDADLLTVLFNFGSGC